MLHLGILPNHRAWADFFANLARRRGRRGARLPRRVRLARRERAAAAAADRRRLRDRAALRARSATIANPGELAERLTGLPDVHGGRRATARPGATKTIAMWNPPIVDEQLATRRSALAEAADLLAELVAGARARSCS